MAMLKRSLDNLIRRFYLLESSKCYAADAKSNSPAVVLGKDKGVQKSSTKKDLPRDERGLPTVPMGLTKPDDPMVQLGYGVGKTAIRLDWWINNQRWHYWANWGQLRDVNRRKYVSENAQYHLHMHTLMDNNILPVGFRESVETEMTNNLPRWKRWGILRQHCQITGRRRGKVLRYRVSRIVFRDMADHGKLAGVMRSCF